MGENEFSDKDKIKALLCCDRHCCLCDKQCSTNMEIHHIEPRGEEESESFDNAMPLCFDCHAKIEAYNKNHPIGIKYRHEELKNRRNQIYDKYTSSLVPNINFEIKSEDVKIHNLARFFIYNLHQYLPCKVKTIFTVYHNQKLIHKHSKDMYGGATYWILNPNSGGNFPPNFLPNIGLPDKIEHLQVQIEATIIDKLGWEHKLLPVSWIWTPESKGWYFHPFSKEEN
ncbi:MAG: HNH endonuclease [Nanoarchaeota archaeon]